LKNGSDVLLANLYSSLLP